MKSSEHIEELIPSAPSRFSKKAESREVSVELPEKPPLERKATAEGSVRQLRAKKASVEL